eukprot:6198764-Pleurochrysis_carterae.AAC.1
MHPAGKGEIFQRRFGQLRDNGSDEHRQVRSAAWPMSAAPNRRVAPSTCAHDRARPCAGEAAASEDVWRAGVWRVVSARAHAKRAWAVHARVGEVTLVERVLADRPRPARGAVEHVLELRTHTHAHELAKSLAPTRHKIHACVDWEIRGKTKTEVDEGRNTERIQRSDITCRGRKQGRSETEEKKKKKNKREGKGKKRKESKSELATRRMHVYASS